MAKGLKKHQEHQQNLSLLGKDLARRSGRKCELCHAAGTSLTAVEVVHQTEPSLEACLFLCETCNEQLFQPKKRDENYLRCLNNSIWSETPLVQASAIYLLSQLKVQWAEDLVEQVYLYPELEQLVSDIDKNLT